MTFLAALEDRSYSRFERHVAYCGTCSDAIASLAEASCAAALDAMCVQGRSLEALWLLALSNVAA